MAQDALEKLLEAIADTGGTAYPDPEKVDVERFFELQATDKRLPPQQLRRMIRAYLKNQPDFKEGHQALSPDLIETLARQVKASGGAKQKLKQEEEEMLKRLYEELGPLDVADE